MKGVTKKLITEERPKFTLADCLQDFPSLRLLVITDFLRLQFNAASLKTTLTLVHEAHTVRFIAHPSAVFPHAGVVSIVPVLDPPGLGRDGDNVKNYGENQQQGHDPPAPCVGEPTAEHFCAKGARRRSRGRGKKINETNRESVRAASAGVLRVCSHREESDGESAAGR